MQQRPLAALLGHLNRVLRGWTNYFRYGVSKRTFDYLGQFTWNRVLRWLRRKHPRASWGWLRRRYLPRWWPTHGTTELLRCGHVTVTSYATGARRSQRHGRRPDDDEQQPTGTGLGRAGCGGTRTSGSEVRAGETDHPKGRYRAPARPYLIAWLAGCRRLRIRYERDSERFFAFAMLACARLGYNRLRCTAEAHPRSP
jgi:hypothetical protein